MTKKDKFNLVLLTIFTLGFCWLHWYLRNKKRKNIILGKKDLNISDAKSDELISLLGGVDNIISLSAKGSKLIVEVSDKNIVNVNQIKSKKIASGIMISTSKITLIMGEQAHSYAQKFNK
ncbi:PTS sugar transporter subunit [Mycoplasmopsis californica]|uniref:PTS sugar transporter subunit n=1 Tax=Mycoplasmopsis californica TaxID=2113 RepID=A0A059XLN5_9BACT|nr:PTS transporter subunit EIIB [Mycoplasmopsis californica]AIA29444.1 PTS sugar transporter subunit [Mycoplasmopsis californica]